MVNKKDITENTPIDDKEKHIVGIGSSAGGIEALSLFVRGLVANLGCSYVVVQHLSPNYKSMLTELLGRESPLPVQEIADNDLPQPDTVYVVPPNYDVILKKGRLHLMAPSKENFAKPSVNFFFRSLAEERGENSIGIILSGTGTDGANGIVAIKAAGGVTFAQSPDSAKYTGMPQSAIDSGAVDYIVAPEKFGTLLEKLLTGKEGLLPVESDEYIPTELMQLLDLVRQKTKIDFSSYKTTTLLRRIKRRIVAVETETLTNYLAHVNEYPQELDILAKDVLISVTSFFRDKEAFRIITRYARDIISKKTFGEEIRVWVAGCATGEEAYSFAIMFAELLGEDFDKYKLQIFATDIDTDALAVARRGYYPKVSVAELTPSQIENYFNKQDDGYQISKKLRDVVVFARQDLAIDPPFVNLDLTTCRNVLIYFNSDLQSKVLQMFHYSLSDGGILFLGRSENCARQERLFSSIERQTKIYRKINHVENKMLANIVRTQLTSSIDIAPKSKEKSIQERVIESILGYYTPTAALINSNFKILHSYGSLGKLVSFPIGQPDLNLMDLVVPEFRNELLTTMHKSRKTADAVKGRKRKIASLKGAAYRLIVKPVSKANTEELFLVLFEEVKIEKSEQEVVTSDTGDSYASSELVAAREHLQTMIEELSTANEEMQALNEEVQASNEEMQATNEELEASNEELQAVNEELLSVNEELLIKTAQIASTNADFESVYNTMEFPLLVFDHTLALKRFNDAAFHKYRLNAMHIGQHISMLNLPVYLKNAESDIEKIMVSQGKETINVSHEDETYKLYVSATISNQGDTQSLILAVVDNSDLVLAKRELEDSKEQLLSIMNHSVAMVSLKDTAGRYQFINRRFEEFFGVSSLEVIGKTDHQIFSPEIAETMRSKDLEVMHLNDSYESQMDLEHKNAKYWLKGIFFPIFDGEGVTRSICAEMIDNTGNQQAEEQLKLAAKVFDRAGEAIVITNASANILTVNDAFTAITGYTPSEVVGKNVNILKSGKQSKEFYAQMWEQLSLEGFWQGEITNKRKDGVIYPEWLTINVVHDANGKVVNYVSIFSDVTAIKNSQKKIQYMATHDELTGLPNRALFLDRLKHTLAIEMRRNGKIAVFFIDLDNFKTINDTLGHDVGDSLLKEAGLRLQKCVRDSDTLARLGGDEFTAIITYNNIEEVVMIADRIVDFLSASYKVDGKSLFISSSIGIAIAPTDGKDSAALIKNADTAMYRAKENGKNQFQFFADEMKLVSFQRLSIETGLRLAIEHDYFSMNYQPQVSILTGEIVGAEALLRWNDPTLGFTSPAVFIPIAEKSGLIVSIGEIVFDKVLKQLSIWKSKGFVTPRMSINVSSTQIKDSEYHLKLSSLLTEFALEHNDITIELTEGILMDRQSGASEVLNSIKNSGARISIDDFGTGYSSLSYLKRMPISEIKIDKSFVDGIHIDESDKQISTAIISIAKALGLETVAEGVENEEQLEVLKTLGCSIAQGYFFYKPMCADDFQKLLKKREKDDKETA